MAIVEEKGKEYALELAGRVEGLPAEWYERVAGLRCSDEVKVRMVSFLRAFREMANMRAAMESIGYTRKTLERWRTDIVGFRELMEDAREDAVDRLDQEAWQRGFEGSDGMLMFLLKAHRPDVYRNTAELTLTGKLEQWTEALRGAEGEATSGEVADASAEASDV